MCGTVYTRAPDPHAGEYLKVDHVQGRDIVVGGTRYAVRGIAVDGLSDADVKALEASLRSLTGNPIFIGARKGAYVQLLTPHWTDSGGYPVLIPIYKAVPPRYMDIAWVLIGDGRARVKYDELPDDTTKRAFAEAEEHARKYQEGIWKTGR